MKTATIRGLPLSVQQDGWWMEGIERQAPGDSRGFPRDMRGPIMLLALIALADAMVWQVVPGLSLAFFALCLVGAACLMAQSLSPQRAIAAGTTALISVVPVVELVQPLSVLLLCIGTAIALSLIAGVRLVEILRAAARYPVAASVVAIGDVCNGTRALRQVRFRQDPRRFLLEWTVPILLGFIFCLLLTQANPVLDQAFQRLLQTDGPNIDLLRIAFWIAIAFPIWGGLIAAKLRGHLTARAPLRQTVKRQGLINAASVTRSLILFNALFFVQTGMDLIFLWAASDLPDGMSFATYAHRGAYPLLATALLAGLFAVLARPYTDDSPLLRVLLILWLLQTLALVAASLSRLEIYVDAYGLTRLRVAAAIWMAVVAAGLGLVIWQVIQRFETPWMLRRCVLLGLATLYVSSFINIDATIAWYNLTRDVVFDRHYICSLSEGAIGPILQYHGDPATLCGYEVSTVFEPQDWREWGFRNWRLRTSLPALLEDLTP